MHSNIEATTITSKSAMISVQEEVLIEQEKLKEEQCNIQKRSEHLLSIMQQFKGMWRHCLYGNRRTGEGAEFFVFHRTSSMSKLACSRALPSVWTVVKRIHGWHVFIMTIKLLFYRQTDGIMQLKKILQHMREWFDIQNQKEWIAEPVQTGELVLQHIL